MKYLVMETHPAYAVLLDESGRFLKAANLNYQVGDTVQDILEMKPPSAAGRTRLIRRMTAMAAAAACFCLVFFGYYQPNFVAYGTIFIRINPEVEITVSRTERVLELDGRNPDGEILIAEYEYKGKERETVTRELIQRAMDMGYLSGGDSVTVSIDSADMEWKKKEEEGIRSQMEEEYGTQIVIHVGDDPQPEQSDDTEEPLQIIVPVPPAQQPENPAPDGGEVQPDADGGAGDGVSDYGDSDYEVSDYSAPEQVPEPQEPVVQDNGDSGYEDAGDGDSGYDGGSAYGDSAYAGDDDGDSGYEDD